MSALQNLLNERLQPVRLWYSRLNPRERRLVTWGGVAAAVMIFFGGIVLPLYGATAKAAQRVEQKQDDLSWMRGVAGELRAAGPAAAPSAGGSLIVVVDQSAQQSGLGSSITGSQPSGNGGLRVRVEGAPFDTLVGWLALLEQQHGIGVETASVDRTPKPGRVNASLVLRQSAAGGK